MQWCHCRLPQLYSVLVGSSRNLAQKHLFKQFHIREYTFQTHTTPKEKENYAFGFEICLVFIVPCKKYWQFALFLVHNYFLSGEKKWCAKTHQNLDINRYNRKMNIMDKSFQHRPFCNATISLVRRETRREKKIIACDAIRYEIGIVSIWHLSLTDEIFNSFHSVSNKLFSRQNCSWCELFFL